MIETFSMRMKPRAKYLSLVIVACRSALAYRKSLMFNLLANLMTVVMFYFLWKEVFSSRERVGDFNFERMKTYLFVAYAVNNLLSFTVETRMVGSIRTGQIAMDLLKPLDFQTAQIAYVLGNAVVESILSCIITLAIASVMVDIVSPGSAITCVLFTSSVALSFLIKAVLGYMVGLLSVWTIHYVGLILARTAITNLLSGALIPLSLLPTWIQSIALFSPFQAIVNAPLSIYLGGTDYRNMAVWLLGQVSWLIVLCWVARKLWAPCVRAITIQGG